MTKKVEDYSYLRRRINSFLSESKIETFGSQKLYDLNTILPVEVATGDYLPVDDLPSTFEELPFIPERIREFAFRYATEYKTIKQWCRVFNTAPSTIANWLKYPGVKTYIGMIRRERRLYTLAMTISLERNMYNALQSLLTRRVTDGSAPSILGAIKLVYSMLHRGASQDTEKSLEININTTGKVSTQSNEAYPKERNVTPTVLKELKDEIDELEVLAKSVGLELE